MDNEPSESDIRPVSNKIKHASPGFGGEGSGGGGGTGGEVPLDRPAGDQLMPMAESAPATPSKKITAFGTESHHTERWKREPVVTGTGACHVRTFHSKLNNEALAYMDRTINEWLDAHPEYEVKFVSSTVGELSGKLKEPNLICQLWM